MTKYYKLSLSPTPAGVMDSSGTNVLGKSSFKGGNVELVWELADTHIANQFYNITEAAIADEYRWLHWNLYDANQSVNMQLLINTLNADIDTQGADPLLKLSITDSMKEMNDKLNEVHFILRHNSPNPIRLHVCKCVYTYLHNCMDVRVYTYLCTCQTYRNAILVF